MTLCAGITIGGTALIVMVIAIIVEMTKAKRRGMRRRGDE